MDIEKIDQEKLELLVELDKPDVFGPTFIQRHLRISSCHACRVLDRGEQNGLFERVKSSGSFRLK